MSWEPTLPPSGDAEFREWAFEQLSQLSSQVRALGGEVLNVEPDKPFEGMKVTADGTNWDPGRGEGQYVYVDGAWVYQGSGAILGTDVVDSDGNVLTNDEVLNDLVGIEANLLPDPSFGRADSDGLLRYWSSDDGGQITIDSDGGENLTPAMVLAPLTGNEISTFSRRYLPARTGEKFYIVAKVFVEAGFDGADDDFSIEIRTYDRNLANPTDVRPTDFTDAPTKTKGSWVLWEYTLTIADADATFLKIAPVLQSGATSGSGNIIVEWLYVSRQQFGATLQADWSALRNDDGNKPADGATKNSVDLQADLFALNAPHNMSTFVVAGWNKLVDGSCPVTLSGTNRFICDESGLYLFIATMNASVTATAVGIYQVYCQWDLNGVPVNRGRGIVSVYSPTTLNNQQNTIACLLLLDATAGDYVRMTVTRTGVSASSAALLATLSVTRLNQPQG